MTNLKEEVKEILECVYGAILRPDQTGKEVISQATNQILQAFEIEIVNRKFNASPKYEKG